jgi:hypothetical protein
MILALIQAPRHNSTSYFSAAICKIKLQCCIETKSQFASDEREKTIISEKGSFYQASFVASETKVPP